MKKKIIFTIISIILIFIAFKIVNATSVGINDNGTLITNNESITYGYSTNGLKGVFNFYNGSFYSSRPSYIYGFSLQLNANINISLDTTLWIQAIARVSNSDSLYEINFLDNIWNVTKPNSSINFVNGFGNIFGKNYYGYEYPITFVSKSPFELKDYIYVIDNSSYPQIKIYFQFKNSTYQSGKVLLDTIIIEKKSNNPRFLIGSMGGFAPETINSLISPFVLQYVVCGYSKGSELFVFNWNASIQLFYLYNNTWYQVPSAYQDSPSNFAGGVTFESINQLDGIKEYYINGTAFQTNGILNQSILWIPRIVVNNNSKNYFIDFIPTTLWNITIIGQNTKRNIIGGVSNITLPYGNYTINGVLEASGKPIESIVINLNGLKNKSKTINSFNNSYLNQFSLLIYIAAFIIFLLIIATIIRIITKH
ncbi:MAG: thermopsin family protease [Caldisphaera sp.]|jgi:hypothetical protein|nr:MAG: hypothetical protein C0171_02205 [Caldisphaera sp.]